jgi:hypothetical protein
LQCGAVSLIKTVKHPISLARAVMELTKHNHLIGKAAEKLAGKANLEVVDPSYFSTPKRREQLKRAKEMGDTVVNDHDYEEDGDDTDENVPLAEPEPEIPNTITTAVTKNENSSTNRSTGNCSEEPDKITLVERIFIDDISTPDSGNSVTDSTEHEALDYDSSEYDSRMSKKYYDPPQTYNDNHDKNHVQVGKSPNALEREREREKEKLLESFYPGSTGELRYHY